MRTFLTYSFYLCGVFFLIYEMLKIGGLNLMEVINDLQRKSETEQKENEELKLRNPLAEPAMSNQLTFGICGLIFAVWCFAYTAWTAIGLWSSQWVIFLILFVLGLVTALFMKVFSKHKDIIFRIDGVITVFLLIFLFINRFHLNIL
jgi:hypothetical protein